MPENLHTAPEPSMTSLVTGIVHDAEELVRQQLTLFKHEVKDDLRKTKEAAIALGVGIGVALLGGLFLCLMIVHLLSWAFSLQLWVSYAIVGGFLVVVGGLLFFMGKAKMQSFNPLPDQSVGALKENVQWIMRPK